MIIILILLGFFCLGSLLANFIFLDVSKKKNISFMNELISLNNKAVLISSIFIIFSMIIYVFFLIKNSGLSFNNMISFMNELRPLLKDNKVSINFICVQLFSISKAIAYIFIFIFVYDLVLFGKSFFKYLIPAILYIIFSLFTSGRIYLIYLVIFTLVMFFVLFDKYQIKQYKSFKIILKCMVFALLALIMFALLANVVGRNTTHNSFTQLSVYIGGPLVSFDQYLDDFKFIKPEIFGQETLTGVYQFLNQLGLSDISLNRHLEFTNFGDNWGNVFTAARRYFHDYNFSGGYLIFFIIGFLYTWFYLYVKNKRIGFHTILYAYLIYPVTMLIIDDVLLSSLLSINTLFEIFYLCVIAIILIPKIMRIKIKI